MKQIDKLLAALKKANFKANKWRNRIYLNALGRDITAYFVLDDPDQDASDPDFNLWTGAALRVFTDAGLGLWGINRRKMVKHAIAMRMYESGIWTPSDPPPPSEWRDMGLTPEENKHQ